MNLQEFGAVMADRFGRINGTTYPSDRAPVDSLTIIARPESRRQRFLGHLAGLWVDSLRPKPGDVLVVRTDNIITPGLRWGINAALRRAGGGVCVFLPMDCRAHCEPERLRSEDRGNRQTANEVYTGVPE